LRRTLDAPDFAIVADDYVADFTVAGKDLIGGNLNDDFWVDILDFGVFTWQWGVNYGSVDTNCATAYPHADINGDDLVNVAEFTFIQIHFLEGHDANCCGAGAREADDGPITQISVKELRAMGLGRLVRGDLNQDGMLDVLDIAAFAQGQTPIVKPRESTRVKDEDATDRER
jgi:hypothetical protein